MLAEEAGQVHLPFRDDKGNLVDVLVSIKA